jgi:hypothetical protein
VKARAFGVLQHYQASVTPHQVCPFRLHVYIDRQETAYFQVVLLPPSAMELISPLTTLGSISTPESYHTARGSPNAADETGLSSPVEGDHVQDEPSYRDAVPLPHELKSHCQIHMEEQLCSSLLLTLFCRPSYS